MAPGTALGGGDDNSAGPQAATETAENPIVLLSAVERDAMDALAARTGFADRAALICALCRRAITDAQPSWSTDVGSEPPVELTVT